MPFILWADPSAEMHLAPYREYLINGTYEGADWSFFSNIPKSRYDTFKAAFEQIDGFNPIVVELGTSRSFTHGGHPGCNLDDPIFWTPDHPENWDWGAGFFTRMVSICLAHQVPQIHTVDLIRSHINRCKVMTSDYQNLIQYHVASSEDFLRNCDFPQGIDLLYLDTGDMTPIEPTAQLQLAEAKIIVERNLIAKGGLILIDDVRNQTPKKFGEISDLGKSKYSLPYLLENGFELVMDEYQVLLRKK
ncbi:MAG: hypothetical protein JSS09_10260 [Verrucomicrobia bacterium]|nr:hypothetical protein [Verrucomicrobiota bacterium]